MQFALFPEIDPPSQSCIRVFGMNDGGFPDVSRCPEILMTKFSRFSVPVPSVLGKTGVTAAATLALAFSAASPAVGKEPKTPASPQPSTPEPAKPAITAPAAPTPVASAPADSSASGGLNPPIASIDLRKVFEGLPKTKEAQDKLNADREVVKKELDSRLAKRKALFDEIINYDKSIAEGKLAITELEQTKWLRQARTLDLGKMDGQIREFSVVNDRKLQDQWGVQRDKIMDDIRKAIAESPSLGGCGLLFNRGGSTATGMPFVVFSSDRLDRSSDLRKDLGTEKKDAGAPAAPGVSGLHLALIDLNKVFAGYYKARDTDAAIKDLRAKANKHLEESKATAGRLDSEIKTADVALEGTLTNVLRRAKTKERENKVEELDKLNIEIAKIPGTAERQAAEMAAQARTGIVEDIIKAVDEAVKANGQVDLLLDAGGASLNGVPACLYEKDVPDWTDAVVAALNSAKPDAKKPATPPKTATVSTAGIRFAVVDLQRVCSVTPAVKAADKAFAAAQAAANLADATPDPKINELETAANKLRAELVDKMARLLAGKDEKTGYQCVFDSSARSRSGVPLVIVEKSVTDISEEMISALGGTHP